LKKVPNNTGGSMRHLKQLVCLGSCTLFITTKVFSAVGTIVDDVVSWGIGISGGTSLAICRPEASISGDKKPVPYSFYLFNAGAVTYWAMDVVISDKDRDAEERIKTSSKYSGLPEQTKALAVARDVALANKEKSEKKGYYKLGASVVMLAAGALAYYEGVRYDGYVKRAANKARLNCVQGGDAAGVFKSDRCDNIGAGKVSCSSHEDLITDSAVSVCNENLRVISAAQQKPALCQQKVTELDRAIASTEEKGGGAITGAVL